MKKFSLISLVSLILVLSMVLSACGNKSGDTGTAGHAAKSAGNAKTSGDSTGKSAAKPVKITFLNSKAEIKTQLEDAAKAFTKANPNITVNVITTGTNQSPVEAATSLYASGTPATLTMLDAGDIAKFKDKAADLSNEKWVKDMAQPNQIDGKTIAFPFAIEGYGLIYNKTVLDKVFGGKFDPSTIKTRTDLENLFKKIKASGTAPLIIGSMNWSLGNHFLPLAYATQPGGDVATFLKDLKAGKVDLTKNKQFNGLMDTFDMMEKYNNGKSDPLAVTYEQTTSAVANGQAAMTFNGDWSNADLDKAKAGGDYGFVPVPISNNASDKANSALAAGATKQVFIDKTVNTPAQQAAAKKFLNWLVYNPTGQDYLVNKMGVIPAFNNIKLAPKAPLAKAIQAHLNAGTILPFGGNYVPADHWQVLGASMQKYLAGKENRAALAKSIENYWKQQK